MNEDVDDIGSLSDADLALFAQAQRRDALRGNRYAHGWAHEAEKELRRRGGYHTEAAPLKEPIILAPLDKDARPWWRRWL